MSSVLKALKKLEEERRGESAASGPAAGQSWASGGQPPRRPRFLLLAISGLAVGLLVVLALLWPRGSAPPVVGAPPPVAEIVTPAVTMQPAASAPDVVPVQSPPLVPVEKHPSAEIIQPARMEPVKSAASSNSKPVETVPEHRPAPVPAPSLSLPPAPVPETVVSMPSKPAPSSPPVREVVRTLPPEVSVRQVQINRFDIPSPGQQWVAPPQLTVSEIFPPAGGERMAIVNGLPVMVGTMVEEAMVEEIHDDRVIISINGKQVALPLQKGR